MRNSRNRSPPPKPAIISLGVHASVKLPLFFLLLLPVSTINSICSIFFRWCSVCLYSTNQRWPSTNAISGPFTNTQNLAPTIVRPLANQSEKTCKQSVTSIVPPSAQRQRRVTKHTAKRVTLAFFWVLFSCCCTKEERLVLVFCTRHSFIWILLRTCAQYRMAICLIHHGRNMQWA